MPLAGGRTSLHALLDLSLRYWPSSTALASPASSGSAGSAGGIDGCGGPNRGRARRGAIDDAVLGPMRSRIGDRPLVVVPTVALHAVPWAANDRTRAGRCRDRRRHGGRASSSPPEVRRPSQAVVLCRRRQLPGRRGRSRSAARSYPDAARFSLETTRTVAVTDGRLTWLGSPICPVMVGFLVTPMFCVLKLPTARSPSTTSNTSRPHPRRVVLAACHSGVPAERPGDEILGLLTVLLARYRRRRGAEVSCPCRTWTRRR